MKRFIILTLVLGLIFCGATVFANGKQRAGEKEAAQTQGPASAQPQGIQSQDVEKWKGKEVKALNDEKLGRIKNFVTENQAQGQFAVISVSGRELAVPIEALSPSRDGKYLTLNMTKDQMKDAPKFSQENLANRSYTAEVYRFYGIQPRWSDQSSGPRETTPGATPGGSSSPGASSYGAPGAAGTPGGGSPSSSGSSMDSTQGEPTGQGK
jgi:hypothetical protein